MKNFIKAALVSTLLVAGAAQAELTMEEVMDVIDQQTEEVGGIRAVVDGSTVTLSGNAESEIAAQAAIDAVQNMEEVDEVIDLIATN